MGTGPSYTPDCPRCNREILFSKSPVEYPVEYLYQVKIPRDQFHETLKTEYYSLSPWFVRYVHLDETADFHACRKCYYTRIPMDKKDVFSFVPNFVVRGK